MFSDCWRRRENKRPRLQPFNIDAVCFRLTSSARRNFPNSRWWRSKMEEPCSLASGLPDLLDVHKFITLTPPNLTPHHTSFFYTHDLLCQHFLTMISVFICHRQKVHHLLILLSALQIVHYMLMHNGMGYWQLVMSQGRMLHSQTS